MLMKKKQDGFSGLIAILVLVLLIGLIGTGWYVWNSKKESEKASNQSTTATKNDDSKTATKEGYTEYKNDSVGLKFNYPKEWGMVKYDNQGWRNRNEFEPVKTHYFLFDKDDFLIKVSPADWKFTGGQGEWDFPMTEERFKAFKNNHELLYAGTPIQDIFITEDAYLVVSYEAISLSVVLTGAKELKLPKINANYVEIVGPNVDGGDNIPACVEETDSGYKASSKNPCYEDKVLEQAKIVLSSISIL